MDSGFRITTETITQNKMPSNLIMFTSQYFDKSAKHEIQFSVVGVANTRSASKFVGYEVIINVILIKNKYALAIYDIYMHLLCCLLSVA